MGIFHEHLPMEFTYLNLFVLREFQVMFLILITEIGFWQLNFLNKVIGIINFVPEFYGDLVYKFKKLKGINDFSFQFRKIITRYRRVGYNLNVMRQSACLVFNPIMVDNYAAFFNCTPVGRASDSMMAPT